MAVHKNPNKMAFVALLFDSRRSSSRFHQVHTLKGRGAISHRRP